MRKLVELYGWYGMAAIIPAYGLARFSVIESLNLRVLE
jgi:hypothetical protein